MRSQESIADLVAQLSTGWGERVEFDVWIQRHTLPCRMHRGLMTEVQLRHFECDCKGDAEARSETREQPPLIAQLEEATREQGAISGGDGRSATKIHASLPGNQSAFELLEEITTFIGQTHADLRTLLFPTHTGKVAVTASQIPIWCVIAADAGHLDQVADIRREMRRLVNRARIVLGYDVPTKMLADTVCGECGGALAVAEDASSDVRCIGTPDAPSCKTVYARWDWIKLMNESEAA